MTPHDITRLRSRWSRQQISEISRLLASGKLGEVAVPTVELDGVPMRDLRGITIIEPIENVHLRRIDFSYCKTELPGSIVSPRLEECRFIGADFRKTNIGERAVRCDWSHAKFHVLYGAYENCSFVGANFSGAKGSGLKFVRCDLRETDWRKAIITRSTFERCNWDRSRFRSGSFCWSLFIGMQPDVTALGNTMMDGVVYK